MTLIGNYTPTRAGKALAAKTKAACQRDGRSFVYEQVADTFEKTAASAKTSPSEKAVADFGKKLSGPQYYQSDFSAASYHVLNTLAAGTIQGPVGAALATIIRSAADRADFKDPWHTIADRGLRTIADHCQDSNDGQLAALAGKFQTSNTYNRFSQETARNIQRTTINAIVDESQGETGQVLANLTEKAAAQFTGRDDSKWAIFKNGLNAIADSPTADAEHKLLAGLGQDYFAPGVQAYQIEPALANIIGTLAHPMTGSMTDRICDLSIKTGERYQIVKGSRPGYDGSDDGIARVVLEAGFEALLANPKSTPVEKELAESGAKIARNNRLDNAPAVQQSMTIMQQVKEAHSVAS